MTRTEINDLIERKKVTIQFIKDEITELIKQELLMSDEAQQYYEEEVEVIISKRPKKTEKQLHGYITWKEKFMDESTNETFEVERNQLVRVNGEFI